MRPTPHIPHVTGLSELDRLADEAIALAEQIKAQVQQLRDQDESGDDDQPET